VCTSFPVRLKFARIATARGYLNQLDARPLPKAHLV
jgi:hypothetical protein